MTFLPIVERELRVAARKRSTFWLRVIAALVSLAIGSGILILSKVGVFNTTTLGGVLFTALTWLALGAALSAGLFFTSDCLSEEKREGTLGFLFLTDLRGYDVAGGKLLATSLRGFFALLAVFPILAITLLMGGVTGVQFWQTTLALVNALFCSLAAGMAVSAISRDPQRALAGTLFLLVLWTAGGPLADSILSVVKKRSFEPVFSLSSPFYVFTTAAAWGKTPYWTALLITQGVAWLLFSLASVLVPRTWQERAARTTASSSTWAYAWRYGGVRRRAALRRKLIGQNPVLWLACRERWQSLGVWAMAVLVADAFLVLFASQLPPAEWMVWTWVSAVFTLILYLWAASQACRFFVEARRSGLIELLLAAPVTVKEIVDGQWRALLRLFGVPVVLLLSVQLAGACVSARASWGQMAAQLGGGMPALATTLLSSGASVIITLANLVALSWFGMWMGMTSKNNNLATLKTIVFVQIIPWFAITFASALSIPLLIMPLFLKGGLSSTNPSSWAASKMMTWYPLVSVAVAAALNLAKDIGFVVWARRKLYASFRDQASRSLSPFRPVTQPLVPPPVATPPVIQLQQ
jgi:hypothetical protein